MSVDEKKEKISKNVLRPEAKWSFLRFNKLLMLKFTGLWRWMERDKGSQSTQPISPSLRRHIIPKSFYIWNFSIKHEANKRARSYLNIIEKVYGIMKY